MAVRMEFVGKNEQDALETASSQLGIPKKKLKYDLLSHGSTGIFGLVGAKKAKIRVHVPSEKELAAVKTKKERKPSKTEGKSSGSPDSDKPKSAKVAKKPSKGSSESLNKAEEPPAKPKAKPRQKPKAKAKPKKQSTIKEETSSPGNDVPVEAPPASDAPATSEAATSPSAPPEPNPEKEDIIEKATEAALVVAGCVMEDPQVTREENPDDPEAPVRLNLEGTDAALLIGRKGQTLEAVQYLVEMIANRGRKSRVRIQVDVAGYYLRHEENLRRQALRMGEKVKASGRPMSFSPMSAHDRRIVHLALKKDNKVRTLSKGGGYLRKLVILPNKKSK